MNLFMKIYNKCKYKESFRTLTLSGIEPDSCNLSTTLKQEQEWTYPLPALTFSETNASPLLGIGTNLFKLVMNLFTRQLKRIFN